MSAKAFAEILRLERERSLAGLRRIADQCEWFRSEVATERASHAETRQRLHELTLSVAATAERLTTPKPSGQQPAPEFKQFPPAVASALAIATAGFKNDAKREIYEWAAAELLTSTPEAVARQLHDGLPVSYEPDELS